MINLNGFLKFVTPSEVMFVPKIKVLLTLVLTFLDILIHSGDYCINLEFHLKLHVMMIMAMSRKIGDS